jgi:hypothetical protein
VDLWPFVVVLESYNLWLTYNVCYSRKADMATTTATAAARKGTAKLTELLEIEKQMQAYWTNERLFEEDAPSDGKP